MKINQTGIILYTINYEETVAFYKNVFQLKTLYVKEQLTCLDFYGSYLMIEVDDETSDTRNDLSARAKFCMRFNVPDVKEACRVLEQHSIAYNYYEFDWGTLAKFVDPDGNKVGIRSTKEFDEDASK